MNLEKGYNLFIESWGNGSDFFSTQHLVYQSIDDCKLILKMCNDLFSKSSYRGGRYLANDDLTDAAEEIIHKYLDNNLKLEKLLFGFHEANPEARIEYFVEGAREILGYSEYYTFRVFNGYKCYYIENDPKEINLKL